MFRKIKEEEESPDKKSTIEVLYQRKALNNSRFRNAETSVPEILQYLDAAQAPQIPPQVVKQIEAYLHSKSARIVFNHINSADQQCYIVFDKKEKHPVNLFMVDDPASNKHEVLIFSNKMMHIVSIDLKQIESFISNQVESSIFALILRNQPNILFQANFRMEFLVHLISLFEKNDLPRFKIYQSKVILTTQEFDIANLKLGSYEETLEPNELLEKQKNLIQGART